MSKIIFLTLLIYIISLSGKYILIKLDGKGIKDIITITLTLHFCGTLFSVSRQVVFSF